MEFVRELFQKEITKRVILFAFIGLLLYLMKSMLNMFLLTFILTYLMYSLQNFLIMRLKRILRVKQKFMVAALYLLLAGAIVFGLYKFIPVMADQTTQVVKQAIEFYNSPHDNPVELYIISLVKGVDISGYADQGVGFLLKSATNISAWGFNIFIALILSLFFLLEKNRILRFTSKFKSSKVSFIYNEIAFFGKKFLNSFGKVIETQMLIAFINGTLSVIALWIMGFPQLIGLGIMIFVLGLIPVAGVFISLIPLSMIAFSIGGVREIVYVLILVIVLHSLESYVLNPKLMSSKTDLPVFYTFIVLLVSEHFLGVWGLIIGIPIFMFLLDIVGMHKEI